MEKPKLKRQFAFYDTELKKLNCNEHDNIIDNTEQVHNLAIVNFNCGKRQFTYYHTKDLEEFRDNVKRIREKDDMDGHGVRNSERDSSHYASAHIPAEAIQTVLLDRNAKDHTNNMKSHHEIDGGIVPMRNQHNFNKSSSW